MGKFLSKLVWILVIIIIALVVGMISPGEWLSKRKEALNKFYNTTFRFSKTPIAEGFSPNAFDLKIVHVKNTQGNLETYLVNASKNEMLPILEVEETTQVGDITHRFRGVGEEGRSRLEEFLENAKGDGSSALEKALELLGK
jgi:hypothetical protein